MTPRILFWVQHLLGIGHLMRAATLARAFEAHGFAVTLVSGGMAVPGFEPRIDRFVQLPPTRATDRYFKVLVDARDNRIDEAWKAMRRDRLLSVFAETRPDIVLVELYPFGRRQMRFEVEPMLEAAHALPDRPLIVSSVRDILVEPDKPERIDEMVARLRRYFDLVLVHGDGAFIPFETTFPRLAEIADLTRYTGYVVDTPPPREGPGAPGWGEVIVSTGGGAVGSELIEVALAARPLTALADAPWRMLAGHNLPDDRFVALAAAAPRGVTVERARPDFRRLVANCRLSISQGGYNTVMEVLAAGVPAVAVPYAGGLESEQTLRCGLLAERGALQIVAEKDVTPASLAAAIDRAAAQPPGAVTLDTGGAARSAALVKDALSALRQRAALHGSTGSP